MDAVSLKLARNYTNEKLNSLPSNAPTKTVTFDGGIYSVGNDVVNGQVSDVVIKGRSLKNELNYNRDTWAEWNKVNSSSADITGIELISDGAVAREISIPTKLKTSTKYGILFEFKTNTLSAGSRFGIDVIGSYIQVPVGTIGNYKNTFITQTNIVNNRFNIGKGSAVTGNLKMTDFRLFELPIGSEIEADFETLTADELAQKYPYIKGDSVKSTNSVRVKSVGKNLCPTSQEAWKQGLLITTGGGSMGSKTNIYTPGYYLIPQGKISCSQKNKLLYVFFYDENKNFISYSFRLDITVPVNAKYARFRIMSSVDITPSMVTTFEPQCEQGTVATPYEPYKESSAIINLPEPLHSVPSAKDELNVTTGVKTQNVSEDIVVSDTVYDTLDTSTYTNVDVVITTAFADAKAGTTGADGQTHYYNKDGVELAEVAEADIDLEASAGKYYWGEDKKLYIIVAKGTYADIASAKTGLGTTSLNYQLATPIVTKLPAQAPLQVFENGTVYVEPIGDASESTLPSVEMTIPTGTSNKFGVATHDYDGAAADWVLTKNEANCGILIVTNAGGAANIIAPNDLGRFFFVKNDSGYDVVVKSAGAEAGTTIADGNSVIVFNTGD